MKLKRRGIDRRRVVEAYATYDCTKKGKQVPNLASWDWSCADTIDKQLAHAGLKVGIVSGYLKWDEVELDAHDLCQCAVVATIFPSLQSRDLGTAERTGRLRNWQPNCQTQWYDPISRGSPLDESAPLILRPTVSAEAPAVWYIEDGSGRAVALLANRSKLGPLRPLAVGYLGVVSDSASTFMRTRFPDLLAP